MVSSQRPSHLGSVKSVVRELWASLGSGEELLVTNMKEALGVAGIFCNLKFYKN